MPGRCRFCRHPLVLLMPSSYGVLDLAQLSAPIVPLHRLSLLPRSEIGDSFVPGRRTDGVFGLSTCALERGGGRRCGRGVDHDQWHAMDKGGYISHLPPLYHRPDRQPTIQYQHQYHPKIYITGKKFELYSFHDGSISSPQRQRRLGIGIVVVLAIHQYISFFYEHKQVYSTPIITIHHLPISTYSPKSIRIR